MNQYDEADLMWFFGEGQRVFERSPEGTRLRIAAQFAFGEDGIAIETPKQYAQRVWEARQRQCRRPATTMAQQTADELREFFQDEGLCDDGSVDVMPIGAKGAEEAGYTPDHGVLTRYARISRRLEFCSPAQSRALEAYHGEAGAQCELAGVRLGRLVAVMATTEAGSRALEQRFQRVTDEEGGPHRRLSAEIRHNEVAPTLARRMLLDAAEHQARKLLVAAHARFGLLR